MLAHADQPSVRLLAALDVVLNNADRKGGHVLHGTDGGVYGVDHGICLHTEPSCAPCCGGSAGRRCPTRPSTCWPRWKARLDGDLADELAEHLTRREVRALATRVRRLRAAPVYPEPGSDYRAIPWPAF